MKYQYWLSNIEGIGNRTIDKLMRSVGTAEELYFLKEDQLEKIEGVGKAAAAKISESRKRWDTDREYEKLKEQDIEFFSQEMETYPKQLRTISNPPYSIYVKGRLPDNRKNSSAIVGARMCSDYGRVMALKLGKALAECGVSVISGMARGIDAYGHYGALKGGGETFAVLGCGIDVCYPESNRDLYNKILKNGGLISEYPPGQKPLPQLFPARNRMISAFSDTIIVIEAKERSGSLITADYALEQGKDIYAVPGRTTDALSRGCNNLIRQGAGIITGAGELLEDIGIYKKKACSQENLKNLSLEKEEELVYSCVDLRPRSMEELAFRTGYKTQSIAELLALLMEKGLILETFKNYYIRNI